MSEKSPLAEASPTSVTDLMQMDPEELTNEHIEAIVAVFRKNYRDFKLEEEAVKSGKKKRVSIPKAELTLDNLDI